MLCGMEQYMRNKQQARQVGLRALVYWPAAEQPKPLQGAVKVHGMEHYMRNKQHARQLEQEQRARERKAFILEPRQHLDPCTVPEPFALQTKLREVRLQPATPPCAW